MLMARFDGGCNPNPRGHAACACVIYRKEGEVYRQSKFLGYGEGMTNNVAEFCGVQLILEYLLEHPEECVIKGDAQLVINRMNNQSMRCGVGACAPVVLECKQIMRKVERLMNTCGRPVKFVWERRHNNCDCDSMCQAEIRAAKRGHYAGWPVES